MAVVERGEIPSPGDRVLSVTGPTYHLSSVRAIVMA